MRYLAIEPSGRIVHDAMRRRGGVRRGSRISHVTADASAAASTDTSAATSAAAAATAAAAAAVSAADPNDIVIAPVHPAARQTSSVALSRARDPPRQFSRAAPSRTSAHPRSNEHPSCHGHLRDSHESRGITRGALPDDDRPVSQDRSPQLRRNRIMHARVRALAPIDGSRDSCVRMIAGCQGDRWSAKFQPSLSISRGLSRS